MQSVTCTTFGAPGRIVRPLLFSLRFPILLALSGLAGCGSNAANPSAADPHNLSGSWGVYSTSNATGMPVVAFVGSLEVSNGSVTGNLWGLTGPGNPGLVSPCVEAIQSANVQGTIDAANNVTLTVPLTTGVATITASLSTNPQTWVYGFYKIVGGGACAMPSTPMMISQFAPVTGTYNGTLNLLDSTGAPIPGSSLKVSAVITQSAYPDIYGQFVLSGSVTASGACTDSVALRMGGAIGGVVIGQVLLGDLDPASDTISYALFQDPQPTDPNCNKPYQGALTRQ